MNPPDRKVNSVKCISKCKKSFFKFVCNQFTIKSFCRRFLLRNINIEILLMMMMRIILELSLGCCEIEQNLKRVDYLWVSWNEMWKMSNIFSETLCEFLPISLCVKVSSIFASANFFPCCLLSISSSFSVNSLIWFAIVSLFFSSVAISISIFSFFLLSTSISMDKFLIRRCSGAIEKNCVNFSLTFY